MSPGTETRLLGMKKIAVLTSGGDAPGMNAALRAVVRMGIHRGHRIFAFQNGFAGLLSNESIEMYNRTVGDIITRGGTMIGTTRCQEFFDDENVDKAAKNLKLLEIDGLIVIGGDGSLRGCRELHKRGVNVTAIPGTIDNDIYGTDFTIGFDTAVETVVDSIKKLRDTASSHRRTLIMEVMGRHSGWIALKAGFAGGAEVIVIPEYPFKLEDVCYRLESGLARGKKHSIVVIAEGVMTAAELSAQMKEKGGFKADAVVLGYVQRGGSPTANDIILASRLGARAVEEVASGNSGVMVGEVKGTLVITPIDEILKEKKNIDSNLYHLAMDLVH
jgi:6-phosphofructokinase 1